MIKHIWIIYFLLLFINSNIFPLPKNFNEAMEFYQKGHVAFAELDYKNAIEYFSEVEQFIDMNPKFKQNFDHHYRNFSIIDVVKQHESLGTFSPEIEHKIIVLYIKNTDTEYNGKKVQASFNEELKNKASIYQEICKRYVEVLSKGRITLSFKRVDIDATVTKLNSSNLIMEDKEERDIIQADIESIQPYPTEMIFKNLNEFDTYIFYWNDNRLKSGDKGGAKALGGEAFLPLIPYHLYGPKRGRIIISASLLNRPGTLLHEVFHSFEKRLNIKPIHGFQKENKKNFLDWLGEGEYNYYQFHFNEMLNKNQIGQLSFVNKFPNNTKEETIKKNIDLLEKFPIDQIKNANNTYMKANQLLKSNPTEAYKLYSEVIELNPYHLDSLMKLTSYYHHKDNKPKALELIKRAYELNPYTLEICYWMGVEYFHSNQEELSIKYFTEGIAVDSQSSKLFQYRGLVNYRLQNYDASLEDFKTSLKLSDEFKSWIKNYLEGRKKVKDSKAEEFLKELNL